MRKRGLSLIGVMWLIAMLSALALASLGIMGTLRERLGAQKLTQQSAAMAVSGRDYAAAMIRAKRWQGATHFRSPLFPGGESFEIIVQPAGSGYSILSIGRAGAYQTRLEAKS